MFHSTINDIQGYKIKEVLGVVRGNSVRAKWIGADFVAGLKNLTGGELTQYMDLLTEARENAIIRMDEDAKKLGANGIIGMRFMTSQIAQGAAEILVYGTAVILEKK
ncbi:YbjQ family protein [Candidatus Woesearchaeota archaeon]|nr:YbjQ family protein [Candidatus Woesearchaeota archaeon]